MVETKSKKKIQRHEEDRCATVYYREVHSFLLQALNKGRDPTIFYYLHVPLYVMHVCIDKKNFQNSI